MPKGRGFVSQKQRAFAFGTHQPWAEKWAKESKGKKLPKRKNPLKKQEKRYGRRKR